MACALDPFCWVPQQRKRVVALQPITYGIEEYDLGKGGSQSRIQASIFPQLVEQGMVISDKTRTSIERESETEVLWERAFRVQSEVESFRLKVGQGLGAPRRDLQRETRCDPRKCLYQRCQDDGCTMVGGRGAYRNLAVDGSKTIRSN